MKNRLYFTLVIVLSVLAVILSLAFGPVNIPLYDIFSSFLNPNASVYSKIIIYIRLPRILLAFIVGAALSVSGAIMQGVFRNPLADPYVTGIASGAGLGAAIAIVFSFVSINFYFISLFAFIGAILTMLLVFLIASLSGDLRAENVLLVGLGLSLFLSALLAITMYFGGQDLQTVFYWLMGSFSGAEWNEVYLSYIVIIPVLIVIAILSRDLDAMMIGDDHAYSLGIDVKKRRITFIVLTSLITGIAVSFSGIIGFVGLIIPHMIRLIIGPKNRDLILLSIFFGGAYLVIADTIARSIDIIEELPVGIITSIVGIPIFIFLIIREKRYWR